MADFSRQSVDLPTPQRPPSMSLGTSPVAENGGGTLQPGNGAAASGPTPPAGAEMSKQVQEVLGSDVWHESVPYLDVLLC